MEQTARTFVHLATTVLPAHMKRLRSAMASPSYVRFFAEPGVGHRGILRRMDREHDFCAAYVFLEKGSPLYVGITRKLVGRLMDHVRGRDHYTATLAYSMAKEKTGHSRDRKAAMQDAAFMQAFDEAKEYLKSLQVAFVEIEDDVELYLFEVYAAMELKTRWNTFRTH